MVQQEPFLTGAIELFAAVEIKYNAGREALVLPRSMELLILALSGQATYSLNGTLQTVKAGEILWIPSSVMASLLPIKQDLFKIFMFKFHIYDPNLHDRMQNVFPTIKVDPSLEQMLSFLSNNWNRHDIPARQVIEAFSMTIINFFSIHKLPPGDPESSFVTSSEYSPATRKLLSFLEASSPVMKSMDEIAHALGYNKNYLSAIFSKETGYTIRDYTNFQRIRRAVSFFFFWEIPLSETSEKLNFGNFNHFGQTFKKFVGIPPGTFLKACSSLSPEERAQISLEETLLSFRAMPIDDLFASMLHMGKTMEEILQRKSQSDS